MANNHQWLVEKNNSTVAEFTVTAYELHTTTGVAALITSSLGIADLIASGKGRAEEINFTMRRVAESITPVNAASVNHYPVQTTIELQIAEIMRPSVETVSAVERSSCLLGNIWHKLASASADHEVTRIVKVVWERAGQTWTVYGTMTDYTEDYQRTKNIGRATISGVDINLASFAYA